jgi:hypothetical protein
MSSSVRPFPRRTSHSIIAVLLVLKAAVLVFNVETYSTRRQYDARHHAWRARSAGLEMARMAYNSPLYYLPVLPRVDVSMFYENGKPRARPLPGPSYRFDLLEWLQHSNIIYVFGALLIWIYGILPMVVSSHRAWFLASLLLLAMPGFSKIAVMAHPDVLLLFLSSLTFFLTIRWLARTPHFGRNLTLALLAGLTGACRPFAVVPMLLCWVLNVGMLVRGSAAEAKLGASRKMATVGRLSAKVAVVSLIVASLSGGWWVYRYVHTGAVMDAYNRGYVDRYQPLKKDFDFYHYYSTFYFGNLLDVPSRADVPQRPSTNPKGNSFWTQLYSDFWGDHFLYFSGSQNRVERKLWVKRVLFVLALPLSILVWLGIITGTLRAIADAIRRRVFLQPTLFMSAAFWGGFVLFVGWQATAGLLPGKNTTIKFLYIAWAVPFGVGTAASQEIGGRLCWVLFAFELAVAIAAFPMSLNWP